MPIDAFFKNILEHYHKKLPFVAYRKPLSKEVITLLQKEDTLYKINDYSESGFAFSPFDIRKDAILIPFSKSRKLTIENTKFQLKSRTTTINSNIEDKAYHLNLIGKGISSIQTKNLKKVVLSRKEIVSTKVDVIETFLTLLNNYHSAFVYCWFHPKVGLWLGATPETLLKIEDQRLTTMALAGTQTYNGTLDVNWSDKEKKEQQLVTDFINSSLEPFAERIAVSMPSTVKAGNLLHLKTDISGLLVSNSEILHSLLLKLHPTPAVCGFPKIEAMQFILDNENYNREFYSGFLGELNKEAKVEPRTSRRNIENRAYAINKRVTHLFVNLRCMQVNRDEVFIYVGGGITEASNPEDEWQETVNKTKTITSSLCKS